MIKHLRCFQDTLPRSYIVMIVFSNILVQCTWCSRFSSSPWGLLCLVKHRINKLAPAVQPPPAPQPYVQPPHLLPSSVVWASTDAYLVATRSPTDADDDPFHTDHTTAYTWKHSGFQSGIILIDWVMECAQSSSYANFAAQHHYNSFLYLFFSIHRHTILVYILVLLIESFIKCSEQLLFTIATNTVESKHTK